MKRFLKMLSVVLLFQACHNTTEVKTELDSIKVKVDTTVKKIADSARAKGERNFEDLKEKIREIKNRNKNRKDSTQDSLNK